MIKRTIISVILFCLLASCLSAQDYEFIDLGTLGGMQSSAQAINNNGVVVGWAADESGQQKAFRWHRSRGMQGLDLNSCIALAVNDNNTIAGEWNDGDRRAAALYDGMVYRLPGFSGRYSTAQDINLHGWVVGQTHTDVSGQSLAYVWDPKAGVTILPDLSKAIAYGINDDNTVVGVTYDEDGAAYPACWIDGELQLMPTLGGTALASKINNYGVIIGRANIPGDSVPPPVHAVMWDSSLRITDLGTLPNMIHSLALGINDHGDVVGHSSTVPHEDARATLWTDGQIVDLNEFAPKGWRLAVAWDINDHGDIAGWGYVLGVMRGYVLEKNN